MKLSPCYQCLDRVVGPKGKECGEHNCDRFKEYREDHEKLKTTIYKAKAHEGRLDEMRDRAKKKITSRRHEK